MGFNCLKATATSRRQFTFYHSVPRKSWYSLYRPRKDERLSRPWSYPVVLSTGPLDWESSALTTKPKGNPDKCLLLISNNENVLLKIKNKIITNSSNQKLLGMLFNNKFDFDENANSLCIKTSQKLNALKTI